LTVAANFETMNLSGLGIPVLIGEGDLMSHVLPHPIHHDPLFVKQIGGSDLELGFFNIHGGVYKFFITNHMTMTLVAALAVVLVLRFVANRVRPVGEGLEAFQTKGFLSQIFEGLCIFLRDTVAKPNFGPLTDKYIGYVWSIFFFVWFCNVLGLVPVGSLLGMIHPSMKHWGGTATSNLSLNIILALSSFVAILYIGIREAGLKNFLSHFNPLGWEKMLGIGIPLYFLEWMGLLIKCSVLALRLFGTMMAGHLVIAAFVELIFKAAEINAGMGLLVGLVVLIGCVMLTLLELFIATLQAYIFTFLTVLFISSTIGHGHEHEDHHDSEHAGHEPSVAHAH
jgi:F-type H+-transporting ATPase subunit a